MWSAATVLACALAALGRPASSLPPIELVDIRPDDVSRNAEAFVRPNEAVIRILTSSATFQQARRSVDRCGALDANRKLASILVHEEWHVKNGSDEEGAYVAQITALTSMHAPSDLIGAVRRAMFAVRKRERN